MKNFRNLLVIGAIAVLSVTVGCKNETTVTKNEGGTKASAAAAPAENSAVKSPTEAKVADKAAVVKKDDSTGKDKAAAAVKTEEKKVDDPATKARKEMEARRKRIQEIYALGRTKDAKDETALKAIIVGSGPVYERASAIRALGREKRAGVIADLKKMVEDKATAVRIESAIKLYQWKEHKFALPVLKGLRKQGVALRRAFQTGYEKGRPTYDKNAMGFFLEGIKNENVYVRLDSAVGLIEVGKPKKGLPVVAAVLEKEEKYHIRMAAVNYLTPLKGNEKVRKLLQMGTKDKDERVAKRARDVLGIGKKAPAPAVKPAKKAVTAPGK